MGSYSRILHLMYFIEIIFTNYFFQNNQVFFTKILIFILFLTFTIIIHITEIQATKYKFKYDDIVNKYNNIFDKYITNIHKNRELRKQIKNFDIPTHIKIQYIEYLLKNKHTCSICLNIIKKREPVHLTICGHLFHNNCLNHCLNNSDKCPNCRTFIPLKNNISENQDSIIIIDN